MQYHVNESIRDTVRVFPGQGRRDCLRYDMNENPEGLPKAFVESVLSKITPEFLAVYPEPGRFQRKYAEYLGLTEDCVMATNGSDMAIRYLFETFGEKGKEVVTVAPSFEMYWVNCMILGYKHVPVEYEADLTINIDKVIAAVNDDTRIVVLLNPNNPVGNVYSEEEISRVIARAKEVGAVVIIDEAYHYFYPNTFIDHVKKDENVIILRTFSKLFSLAAVRLGVIVSCPEIIHYAKNAKLTFDVNSIALLFGEEILDHPELEKELIETEKAGRSWLLSKLSGLGYEVRDCRGNFIFIRTKKDPQEVTRRLAEEKKVLVHAYRNALLKDMIRVSTGSVRAMEIFLDAFLSVDGSEA